MKSRASTVSEKGLLPRLAGVPVFVSDQDRALDFYTGKLGYAVVTDQKIGDFRWLTVSRTPGEPVLILFKPSPGMNGDEVVELEKRVGTWTGIIFETDDIQATYTLLRDRGVRFEAEPTKQAWGGWETWFFDADGNRFHLGQMQNKK